MGVYQMIASLVLVADGGSVDADADLHAAQELYAQRSVLANHEKAADAFAALAKRAPTDVNANIWCARTAYYASHRLRDDKTKMRRVAAEGVECGDRLLASSNAYDAQLWGLLARFRQATAAGGIPPLGQIEALTRLLESLRTSHPDAFQTYMMLGAVYRELPGWPLSVGDKKKSLSLLLEGTKLAPDNAELLLQLADTYKATGDTVKAKSTYQHCIDSGDGPPELTWETNDARAWAKHQLAELE